MANANAVNITNNATLPPGKGNHLMKLRCKICNKKYSFWEEEGHEGCPHCEIDAAIALTVEAQEKKAVAEKAVFDDAVRAEVAKQVAEQVAIQLAGLQADPTVTPQDEQAKEEKKEEKPSKKGPFSKK